MAWEMVQKVLELSPESVTPTERAVLLVLAYYVRRQAGGAFTHAFVSVPTIHLNSSLTPRAIQKALKRLAGERRFISPRGTMPRGAVRYEIDIERVDRERGSQSWEVHREPRSRSAETTANEVPGTANEVRRSANEVLPDCEPGSPKPVLNHLNQEEPTEQEWLYEQAKEIQQSGRWLRYESAREELLRRATAAGMTTESRSVNWALKKARAA